MTITPRARQADRHRYRIVQVLVYPYRDWQMCHFQNTVPLSSIARESFERLSICLPVRVHSLYGHCGGSGGHTIQVVTAGDQRDRLATCPWLDRIGPALPLPTVGSGSAPLLCPSRAVGGEHIRFAHRYCHRPLQYMYLLYYCLLLLLLQSIVISF